MNIDNNNYNISLLKRALKRLIAEVNSSYWFVESEYMNAVRKALEYVNTNSLPKSLPFSISIYCALIETHQDYNMPTKFKQLKKKLEREIKKFIN